MHNACGILVSSAHIFSANAGYCGPRTRPSGRVGLTSVSKMHSFDSQNSKNNSDRTPATMAIGYTNRGSESIRAGTFRQMRPKFGFAILYRMLLPQYLRMSSAMELFADCLRSRRSERSGAEGSDLNQEQQRTILRRTRSSSDACFPYWPMESMSSKAISP